MEDDTTITLDHQPGSVIDPLTGSRATGARQMLAAALRVVSRKWWKFEGGVISG